MSAVRIARRHRFTCHSDLGRDFSPHGPTHNYELEAYVEGRLGRGGMVMNVRDLDTLLAATVKPFSEMQNSMPSADLAQSIFKQLSTYISQHNARLIKLRLYENSDLWFDVWP